MLARNFHVVTRREFLNDFDVGCKRRACEGALQQIVAEDGVFGDTLVQHSLKRVDVVNAFADIGAFVEQVLIDVGNRERVRIKAIGAGEGPLEQRTAA